MSVHSERSEARDQLPSMVGQALLKNVHDMLGTGVGAALH
jgi:hypothetical protein